MKKISILVASMAFALAPASAQTIIQQWDFTEDGSGLSNRISNQGLDAQHFDNPDPIAFDGGGTVQTASGFSGDRAIGISLTDANTASVILSVTLNSFDFSTGTADDLFGVRLRQDCAGCRKAPRSRPRRADGA